MAHTGFRSWEPRGAESETKMEFQMPTIHLNGTSKEQLFAEVCGAAGAIRGAISACSVAAPNARDYYVAGPGAFEAARTQHAEAIANLVSALMYFQAVAEHIADL